MKSSLLLLLAALLLAAAGCASAPAVVVARAPAPVPVPVHRAVRFTMDSLAPAQADVSVKPRVRSAPIFPDAFKVPGATGYAIVEFIVAVDGSTREVQYSEASDAAFGDAAVAAVEQWSFTPARKNGHPVATRWRQRVDFSARND